MAAYPVRTRRWTRAEYDRLIDIGVFLPHEPLELLAGELIVSEPQGFDREHQGSLYARARLDDYWVLNLVDRILEIYRRPVLDPSAAFGWRYASREVLGAESSVELLAAPGARILVSDLLP